jgi:putative SOS response-associated peptidase YedK
MLKAVLAALLCALSITGSEDALSRWMRSTKRKWGRLYKFFMKDRKPLGVAGIWENWRNLSGDWERTFCIITVEAS